MIPALQIHRFFARQASLLLALFLTIGCASDSADQIEDREETVFYLTLLNGLPTAQEVINACEQSHQSGLNCSSTGGQQNNYLSAFENAFGIDATTSAGTTCSNAAGKLPQITGANPAVPELSFGARICYFECSKNYWDSLNCSVDYSASLSDWSNCRPAVRSSFCTTTSLNDCLKQCLETGTVYWYVPGTAN